MREPARSQNRRRGRRAVLLIAVAALVLVAPASPASAAPVLSDPVTAPGGTGLLTTQFDLARIGYQEAEYTISGTASSYAPAGAFTGDGKWAVTPSGAADYETRIIVRQPSDPKRFKGTVLVEWMNVTSRIDTTVDWIMAHNELVRRGIAYVGVSAQTVGVDLLNSCCTSRYGTLVHPGDSYSYDIFSQTGQVVRDEAATLFPEGKVKRVIAAGESQSASRLVTYLNAVHPLVDVYDGFLVHSRGAGGSSLSQSPLPTVTVPSPTDIRDDLTDPVLVVQAEGDVIGSNLGHRQPDTPRLRIWEMAGTAHADSYTAPVGLGDVGDGQGAIQMFQLMRAPAVGGCADPANAGPHHWIVQAGIFHLERWVKGGAPPPAGPPLTVASTSPTTTVLARDANGNALGGIRSPHVDAPVATLTGIGSGPGFCRLFGSTTPLTTEQLVALYGDQRTFVNAWVAATNAAKQAGFLRGADATELRQAARAVPVLP